MSARLVSRGVGKVRRMARAVRCALKRAVGRPIRIHLENRWRLGDEILALPFYQLVKEHFPDSTLTASVNYPELLQDTWVRADSSRTEFDCDRFIFCRSNTGSRSRLEHLCELHRIPYREIEPQLPVPKQELPGNFSAGETERIAYSCGAGWACRAMPARLFQDLAAALSSARPGLAYVELGKGCDSAGVGSSFIDRLSIAQTAVALSRCALYIGQDSGLAHLAMAVGTPALVLFGPVDPALAFGRRRLLHPMRTSAPCGACWTAGRMRTPGVCPIGVESLRPGDYPCMGAFGAKSIVQYILERQLLPMP